MIFERFIQYLGDCLFLFRWRRANKKFHGRALCSHCLNMLEWHDYQAREIAVTVSQRIMLFCPKCHLRAMYADEADGEWIVTAFRRWYDYASGFNGGSAHFDHCLANVLEYYGWLPKLEPEPFIPEITHDELVVNTLVLPHHFTGRSDRWCEICNRPDRDPIHIETHVKE